MTGATARRSPWWQDVLDAITTDHQPPEPPDPWAADVTRAPALTAAQRTVLVGFDDQPRPTRLRDLADSEVEDGAPAEPTGNGTGSSPGDSPRSHPYRPDTWRRRPWA